jgi:pimeloyl-ACP methyl ester carboxylesterase
MLVDIVSVETKDGVKLHGSHRTPAEGAPNDLPIDVLVMHHGVAGNFYGSDLFDDLSDLMVGDGIAVIRANNRGHDPVSWATGSGGRHRVGAAYELMGDSPEDWDAWIGLAVDLGYKRIGVLGHSLGATKTIYYFGNQDDERVKLAICLSPPRLSYSAFQRDADGPEFNTYVAKAKERLDADDPRGLIDAALPVPFLGSAATYYEKYGPEENVNILTHLPNVKLPLLALHGTMEPAAELPMRGVLEELTALGDELPNFTYAIMAGGDHFYTGQRPLAWTVIRGWLKKQA